MAYSDNHMKIKEENRRDKPREELYRKYYDLMGVLLYKNDYIQTKNSGIKSNYMYYVMLLNVSDALIIKSNIIVFENNNSRKRNINNQ